MQWPVVNLTMWHSAQHLQPCAPISPLSLGPSWLFALPASFLIKPSIVALTIGEADGEDRPAPRPRHCQRPQPMPLSPRCLQYAVGRVPADNHLQGAQSSHVLKPRPSIS